MGRAITTIRYLDPLGAPAGNRNTVVVMVRITRKGWWRCTYEVWAVGTLSPRSRHRLFFPHTLLAHGASPSRTSAIITTNALVARTYGGSHAQAHC